MAIPLRYGESTPQLGQKASRYEESRTGIGSVDHLHPHQRNAERRRHDRRARRALRGDGGHQHGLPRRGDPGEGDGLPLRRSLLAGREVLLPLPRRRLPRLRRRMAFSLRGVVGFR